MILVCKSEWVYVSTLLWYDRLASWMVLNSWWILLPYGLDSRKTNLQTVLSDWNVMVRAEHQIVVGSWLDVLVIQQRAEWQLSSYNTRSWNLLILIRFTLAFQWRHTYKNGTKVHKGKYTRGNCWYGPEQNSSEGNKSSRDYFSTSWLLATNKVTKHFQTKWHWCTMMSSYRF
jgi:hypothetical protein